MISRKTLLELYVERKLSSADVALNLGCSINKVNYWLEKHGIPKRSISDAIYAKLYPNGDPFHLPVIDTVEKAHLYGLGIGLYWGEGTKANKHSVRLGNSDPALIRCFILFLTEIYGVDKDSLRFGLQVFSDLDPVASLKYWCSELAVNESQFYKLHITPSNSIGTYRQKSKHGVLTVYYHNKKLRDIINSALPKDSRSPR